MRPSVIKEEVFVQVITELRQTSAIKPGKSEVEHKQFKAILKKNKFEKMEYKDFIMRMTEKIEKDISSTLSEYGNDTLEPDTKILRLASFFFDIKFTPGQKISNPPSIASSNLIYLNFLIDFQIPIEMVKKIIHRETGSRYIIDLLSILSELFMREETLRVQDSHKDPYFSMIINALQSPANILISIQLTI